VTNQQATKAFEAVAGKIAALPALKELGDELKSYPVRLLSQLCDIHVQRNGPVPDHALTMLPYLGETALRALVEGGYIDLIDDVSYAIHAYAPTESGLALVATLDPSAKRAPKKR
jgi:hypothetical protein